MAFEQLIEIFTLMFEIAPLILILMLFMTVMKMFEDRMGVITILTIGMLLSSSFFIPIEVESEELQDFYSDSKTFNYMDICTIYPIFNRTDGKEMGQRNITNGDFEQLVSYEETSIGGEIKPHKTIAFTDDYLQDSLLLITKLVYNWTSQDDFRISLYYADSLNASTTIYAFYNDYINTQLGDNVSANYKYIGGGLQYYGPSNQSVFQRTTNIKNEDEASNIFTSYERLDGPSNTEHRLWCRNITIKKPLTIKTNEWITLSFKKDAFIWDGNILNSYSFMNFGIYKNHKSHTLIINDIQIANKITKNKQSNFPFKEYYEFKEITDNTTNRLFWHMDMVENNYQTLQVHTLSFGIYSGKLRLYYDGVSQWNSSEMYLDNDPDSLYHHFTGYQFNLQVDDNGHYSIYLYYKWNFNERTAGLNTVTYNYTFQDFVINEYTFSYLHNFEYYGNTNETDIQISFTQNSHKWDVLDTEIRKIDVDMEQQVLLVHDVDSGGFKVPSISDLKKSFTDKIVKPITSILTNIKDEILKPVNLILSSMGSVTSSLTSLQSKLTDTYNTILSGFIEVQSTVNSAVSGLQAALQSSIDATTAAVNNVKNAIDLVKASVDAVETAIGDVVDGIDDVINQVQDLLDAISPGGDLWDLIDVIETGVNSLVNVFSFVGNALLSILPVAGPTILGFFSDIASWLVQVSTFLAFFLDISFTIFGTVFLYRIILGLSNYNESGDINALYSILETLMTVAEYVFVIFRLIVQFIAGIIP